ncbi:MAG TPA: MBL fold metallo-hydrolase [Anaeromyxobacteraceae bacterium]|nr:MBL fold metallo-hydrolase [Anaeromyxobacteraceae bacterium]
MAELRETQLTDRVRVFTLGGDDLLTSYGANCVAVRGDRSTLLVDPLVAPAHARLVAAALARAGYPPVSHVALTHHHTDHALGASLFARAGARVVAHGRCAAAMAEEHPALVAERRADGRVAALFADAVPYAPEATFEGEEAIDLGGVRAELRHLGHGHTPGDAVVLVPSDRLAATGDLVFRGYHFNYEQADREGVRRGLLALGDLAEWFVPGHGRPGGAEVLREQALYHDEAERIARGSPDAEAAAGSLVERFPGFLLRMAVPAAVRFWRGYR